MSTSALRQIYAELAKETIHCITDIQRKSFIIYVDFISSNGWFHKERTWHQTDESDELPQDDAEVLRPILKIHLPSNFQLQRQTPVSTRSVSLGRGAACFSAQSVRLLDYNENKKN